MFFLTILFSLLGFTVDVQPYATPASQGGSQTEHGGFIIVNGSQGNGQTEQGDDGQGGTQADVGGMIVING